MIQQIVAPVQTICNERKRERENLFAKSDNNIASNITVYNGRLPGEHMPIYAGRL